MVANKMYKFSERSLNNIAQCHPDLQKIAHELIKKMDVVVICGHRGEKEQNEAFKRGNSKLKWPDSKHNKVPAEAMDVCPYPIDWDDDKKFLEMQHKIREISERLGIKVRFISWDPPHVELV